MCDPVTATLVAAGASAGVSVYQGEQARKAQGKAAKQARAEADQAFNRANPKKPNPLDMGAENAQAMSGGVGSTMLTGAGGVQPANLLLGRTSLLGAGG